jgi:TetR/AcrR family transcriptional regulator, cholesterol catabolism regulator
MDADRRQLLDAAWKVFKARGYAATSLDEIARESSLPRRFIDERFAGKEELFYVIAEDASDMMKASASELISAAIPDIVANIQGYMAIIMGYRDDFRAYRALIQEVRATASPDFREKIDANDGIFSRELANMLKGLAQKSLIKECDYEATSVAIIEAYAALVAYRDAEGELLPSWRIRDTLQSFLYGGVMHPTLLQALSLKTQKGRRSSAPPA